MNDKQKLDTITWEKWPMSIEEATQEVLEHISEATKHKIANSPRGSLLHFHHGFGQYLRNRFNIWEYYRGREETSLHPDTISGDVVESIWDKLQEMRTYKDKLRDPVTGRYLPEKLRQSNIVEYFKSSRVLQNDARRRQSVRHTRREILP